MKQLLILVCLWSMGNLVANGQVENTSYLNSSNEKVLQLSVIVPAEKEEAWEYFTKDDKLSLWIAQIAHIELKNGGYIRTNYDTSRSLDDSSSITLGIISYLQNELLILKVELNNNFSKKLQDEDENLQEIIQFVAVALGKTKIISSMTGWGQGKDWENTYNFFVKGNTYTYEEFLKLFK